MATPVLSVGEVPVFRDGAGLVFVSGLAVDADGAPTAYAPPDAGLSPLDALGNAGRAGNWWGFVTDTGKPTGNPIVQGPDDPAPGYYVSTTALVDSSKAPEDPRRYVDASVVPYISIPPALRTAGVHMGDLAMVYSRKTGKRSWAIVADIGPHLAIGEGSPALARALGLDGSARRGGASADIVYLVWPGSRRGWPMLQLELGKAGEELLAAWGGEGKLAAWAA